MNGPNDSSPLPATPDAPGVAGSFARTAGHLLALWAFAVAQPVYDILRRNGEFFIAHRTQPLDLVLFAAVVSLLLPLVLVAPYLMVRSWSARLGRWLLLGLVGLLCTLLASHVLAQSVSLPVPAHVVLAVVLGVLTSWGYATRPGLQLFTTLLIPSVLVFPAIFLAHPSMAMFVRPDSRDTQAAAVIEREVPPIVFLVFDQLPLTSLLDASGALDRARYPGLSSLADNATWYRNATTVAEFTGWAVPPIVSGVRPNARRVPTTRSYPHNLFTWLAARYRLEVQEPITQLCPERLCDSKRAPLPIRLASMTLDSSVVYLNVVLPPGLRSWLPPLTENWKNFIHDQRWQRRWVAESRDDRRQVLRDLIASISRDDPQPTLYFAHALLPHEPYLYLRSGQQYADNPHFVGLTRTGRWTSDDWPVTQSYLRHLLQVEYIDAVVGQLMARLREQGLYDKALIVVTADHGVSFRPAGQFKAVETGNAADIMSVPLLIKAPGQQQAVVDDSNIQSVDVMPTIAALLGVPLTWTPDGLPAGAPRPDPSAKIIHHGGARLQTTYDAGALQRARQATVARRISLFGDRPGWRAAAVAHPDLVGARVEGLNVVDGPWQVVVDEPARLRAVNPAGPFVPALLSGWVRDARGTPTDAELIVAVNGVVSAVTRTFRPDNAARGTWSALVDPSLLVAGRNDIRVYVRPPDSDRLHLAYSSQVRPRHLNLASRGAEEFFDVTQSGFYGREGTPISHRWSSGEAVMVVPLEPDHKPRSIRIGITEVARRLMPVTITLNDCTVFSGQVEAPWYRTFSLSRCPPSTLMASHARIVIASPTRASGDQRRLGVAVETVNLFDDDWPPVLDRTRPARAAIRAVAPRDGYPAGTPISIELANVGESTWLPQADAPDSATAVQLALAWRSHSGGRALEQRLTLPHPMYPTDRVVIDAPLVPPAEIRGDGQWTVTMTPVAGDGTPVPMETAFVVRVIDARGSPQ